MDSDKLKDLEHLKGQQIPGPFASTLDVEAFYNSTTDYKEKQDRLYIEVWYAKATCLSMNTKMLSQYFRLRRNGKKLDPEEYRDCLLNYFDTSKSVEQVTLPDLQKTIGTLTESILSDVPDKRDVSLSIDEHVIVYWLTKKAWMVFSHCGYDPW